MDISTSSNAFNFASSGGTDNTPIDNLISFTFDEVFSHTRTGASTEISFSGAGPEGTDFNYVGIAGHNLGTSRFRVDLYVDNVLTEQYTPSFSDNRCIMFTFPNQFAGTPMKLDIVPLFGSSNITIAHIACGASTNIDGRDYGAGFGRVNLFSSRKVRTTINDQAAPTAVLVKTVPVKINLNIKNVTFATANSLVNAYDFWATNAFFVRNDGDLTQCYLGYNGVGSAPKTHGSTRALVDISLKFNAYNGI